MAGFLRSIFRSFRGKKEDDILHAGLPKTPLNSPPISGAFKTKKAVAVPASQPNFVPLLAEVEGRQGGIQGLSWYWKTLKMDEEDDVAHDFLSEVRGSRFSRVLGRSLRAVQGTGETIIEHGNVNQAVVAANR